MYSARLEAERAWGVGGGDVMEGMLGASCQKVWRKCLIKEKNHPRPEPADGRREAPRSIRTPNRRKEDRPLRYYVPIDNEPPHLFIAAENILQP